ncbi:MAG: pentapeptide repeat-containing protein [Hyphomicrobium sp.]
MKHNQYTLTATSMRVRIAAPLLSACALAFSGVNCPPVHAAEFSARDVTARLFQMEAGTVADFHQRDLRELDLSGIDFKRANLAGTKLFGTDLTRTNLAHTDLRGANLDRAVIIGANLNGADLSGISMLRPTTSPNLDEVTLEPPSFKGANMSGSKIFGRFRNVDFSGADLTKSSFAPTSTTGFIENLWRADLMSANLSATILENADLTYVMLRFADLRGANLRGALLKRADLAHADLTGADLTGADVSNADLDGATLTGAKGLSTVKGLATAHNVPAAFGLVR